MCFYPATKFTGSRDFSPTQKLFQQPSVADRKVRAIYGSGLEPARSRNLASTAGLAGMNRALLPPFPSKHFHRIKNLLFPALRSRKTDFSTKAVP